eukprot:2507110-Pleurochrysis_carterae.AAC.2
MHQDSSHQPQIPDQSGARPAAVVSRAVRRAAWNMSFARSAMQARNVSSGRASQALGIVYIGHGMLASPRPNGRN